MRRPLALAILLAPLACVPSPGPFVLDPVRGRVMDRDTGEPIRGAEVIEWYHGAGTLGGPQPIYHSRWTRSDAEGRFELDRELAPSPRMWLFETYGPTLGFFHPSYGLIRSGPVPDSEDAVLLEGSLRDSASRLDDLAPLCRAEPDDAAGRHLRDQFCPLSRLETRPDGTPRWRGALDDRGRRTGTWIFHYEDGSPAARGEYEAGAPVGRWTFFDRRGRVVTGARESGP